MKHEAIILIVLTAASYVLTYSYWSAYLEYFGFGSELVFMSLSSVTVVGAAALKIVIGLQLFLHLPVKFSVTIAQCLIIYAVSIILLSVGSAIFWNSGFSWWSISITLLGIALFVRKSVTLFFLYRATGAISDAIEIDTQRYNGSFMDTPLDRVDRIFSSRKASALVLLLIALPSFGSAFGSFAAERKRDFNVVTIDHSDYAVVYATEALLMLLQVYCVEGECKSLTKTLIYPVEGQGIEIAHIRTSSSLAADRTIPHWTTWGEFVSSI